MAPRDYRDLVIEDQTQALDALNELLSYYAIVKEQNQLLQTSVRELTLKCQRLTETVKYFLAITHGETPQGSTIHPPPRPLSEYPTDAAPYVSVHEIRWK
jgi:hypothetical protein